jgi:hypothetical protein
LFRAAGCHIRDQSYRLLRVLDQLQLLVADDFKMCCPTLLSADFTGQCLAPADDISSCEALLRSDVYRSALAAFAVLAIVGKVARCSGVMSFSELR